MAMLIEAYGTEGAIALGEKFSYSFLSLLLDQTIEMRKAPEEREKENIQDWIEENKERTIEIQTEQGARKINLASFMPIGSQS